MLLLLLFFYFWGKKYNIIYLTETVVTVTRIANLLFINEQKNVMREAKQEAQFLQKQRRLMEILEKGSQLMTPAQLILD